MRYMRRFIGAERCVSVNRTDNIRMRTRSTDDKKNSPSAICFTLEDLLPWLQSSKQCIGYRNRVEKFWKTLVGHYDTQLGTSPKPQVRELIGRKFGFVIIGSNWKNGFRAMGMQFALIFAILTRKKVKVSSLTSLRVGLGRQSLSNERATKLSYFCKPFGVCSVN